MIELSYLSLYVLGMTLYLVLTLTISLTLAANKNILKEFYPAKNKKPSLVHTLFTIAFYPFSILRSIYRNFPKAMANFKDLE